MVVEKEDDNMDEMNIKSLRDTITICAMDLHYGYKSNDEVVKKLLDLSSKLADINFIGGENNNDRN